jgi:hypothetical protein
LNADIIRYVCGFLHAADVVSLRWTSHSHATQLPSSWIYKELDKFVKVQWNKLSYALRRQLKPRASLLFGSWLFCHVTGNPPDDTPQFDFLTVINHRRSRRVLKNTFETEFAECDQSLVYTHNCFDGDLFGTVANTACNLYKIVFDSNHVFVWNWGCYVDKRCMIDQNSFYYDSHLAPRSEYMRRLGFWCNVL